jgi:hypothetical protein
MILPHLLLGGIAFKKSAIIKEISRFL